MKLFFKPLVINPLQDKDPFVKDPKYTSAHVSNKNYRGKAYKKIIYHGTNDLCGKINNLRLAFLATISILPICWDFSGWKKLWKQVFLNKDIKVVWIAKNQEDKPIEDQKEHKVRIGGVRARVFKKDEAPVYVGDLHSVQLIHKDHQ